MQLLIIFFMIFFVVSCGDSYSYCISGIAITEEEEKKIEDYVKANIKPVDNSYKGATYDIEGKKYPKDKVKEAYKKVFPESVKESECEFL